MGKKKIKKIMDNLGNYSTHLSSHCKKLFFSSLNFCFLMMAKIFTCFFL